MKLRVSTVTVLAVASLASAQARTRIYQEVGLDPLGSVWSNSITVQPGTQVAIRTRIALEGATAFGFAGMTYQPTLSGWQMGDHVVYERQKWRPWQVWGRLYPFASSGMGTGSASGALTAHFDPGGVLRIAGANAVTATTNLAWGIGSNQLTQHINGTNFASGTNVVVFRYGLTPIDTGQPRTLIADLPLSLINLRRATWYTTPNGRDSLQSPLMQMDISSATITVIPAPGAAIVLLGAAAWGCHRTRRIERSN